MNLTGTDEIANEFLAGKVSADELLHRKEDKKVHSAMRRPGGSVVRVC